MQWRGLSMAWEGGMRELAEAGRAETEGRVARGQSMRVQQAGRSDGRDGPAHSSPQGYPWGLS